LEVEQLIAKLLIKRCPEKERAESDPEGFIMKNKMIITVLLTMFVAVEMVAQGPVTTAVPFLLIAPNSRAGAMGDAGVAQGDDAWAVYWNPAGYAFQQGSEVALSRADWLPAFGLNDLWIMHGAYKMPVEELDGTVGVGLTYLNLGSFVKTLNDPTPLDEFSAYEFALVLSYGTKIASDLGLGINTRLIHSKLAPSTALEAGEGSATGFSFDIGLMYRPSTLYVPFTDIDISHRLSLGFLLSNIGPKITYIDKDQADPLPMSMRLGLAYKVIDSEFNNMTVLADVSRLLVKRDTSGNSDEFYKALFTTWSGGSFSDQIRQFTLGLGAEYWYGAPKLIALRGGFFYEDPKMGNRKYYTFGAGIRYDVYGFDFSYISTAEENHPLGETLRFSLSIAWGGGGL